MVYILLRLGACDRLDTSDASRNRTLADDLEKAYLARASHVGTTA